MKLSLRCLGRARAAGTPRSAWRPTARGKFARMPRPLSSVSCSWRNKKQSTCTRVHPTRTSWPRLDPICTIRWSHSLRSVRSICCRCSTTLCYSVSSAGENSNLLQWINRLNGGKPLEKNYFIVRGISQDKLGKYQWRTFYLIYKVLVCTYLLLGNTVILVILLNWNVVRVQFVFYTSSSSIYSKHGTL